MRRASAAAWLFLWAGLLLLPLWARQDFAQRGGRAAVTARHHGGAAIPRVSTGTRIGAGREATGGAIGVVLPSASSGGTAPLILVRSTTGNLADGHLPPRTRPSHFPSGPPLV